MSQLVLRASIAWLVLSAIAISNGAFRELVLKRKFGEHSAHVISTLLLSALILTGTSLSIDWIGPHELADAWNVGFLWIALTLAFEFLAGHYLFGNAWSKILADYNVLQGRVWVFVLMVTLVAPPLAFKGIEAQYIGPYAISNAIGVALFLIAFEKPAIARWTIAAIFAYAAVFNAHLAMTRPEEYQGFASLAIVPFYRDLIEGTFRTNARDYLLFIASGQFLIAIATALAGRYLWIGVLGTCVFLAAIIPLGVGSAFPFSVSVSLAAMAVLAKQRKTL